MEPRQLLSEGIPVEFPGVAYPTQHAFMNQVCSVAGSNFPMCFLRKLLSSLFTFGVPQWTFSPSRSSRSVAHAELLSPVHAMLCCIDKNMRSHWMSRFCYFAFHKPRDVSGSARVTWQCALHFNAPISQLSDSIQAQQLGAAAGTAI